MALTVASAGVLAEALREAAAEEDALLTASDSYGERYRIDFEMVFEGRRARVRSAWLVPPAPAAPTFLTAFVL